MSKENAKKFFEELKTNETLKAKVSAVTDPSELVKLAEEMGLDVSREELAEADRAIRAAQAEKTAETERELSAEELGAAAGGALWQAEDAPDGFEMGCMLVFHGYSYQEENNIWCADMYYCTASFQEKDDEEQDCTYGVYE